MRDCEHGRLARSCEICELEAEIERLRAERDETTSAWRDYERLSAQAMEEVERLRREAERRWQEYGDPKAWEAERDRLHAEVERLRAERDQWRYAAKMAEANGPQLAALRAEVERLREEARSIAVGLNTGTLSGFQAIQRLYVTASGEQA